MGLEIAFSESRHPPGHFVLSHAVTRPCELAGYKVPADAFVNFYVAAIGMDPRVWPNPLEFKPERFLDEGVEVDLTGTKEIKMMPFGAGRRVCPGLGMAMLHLNLIVAHLVQEFVWECKPGETVDLSEKQEFTMVMKYPLHALIKQRENGENYGGGNLREVTGSILTAFYTMNKVIKAIAL